MLIAKRVPDGCGTAPTDVLRSFEAHSRLVDSPAMLRSTSNSVLEGRLTLNQACPLVKWLGFDS